MVNCYKNTGLSTPCLDALAASGVRYERAYTTQPVCGPARAGLFTGLYPSSCGSWANCMPLGDNVHTIVSACMTTAYTRHISENGTLTAAIISETADAPTDGTPSTGTICAATSRSCPMTVPA